MGDPSLSHARARKLLATLEFQLQQLEEGPSSSSSAAAPSSVGGVPTPEEEHRHAVAVTLNQLYQELAQLDRAVEEDGGNRRELWRKKAAQLSADAAALRRAVERHLRTAYSAARERRERGLLLGGDGAGDTGGRRGAGGGGGGGGGGDAVSVDAFLQQRSHLTSSHTLVDEFTAQAAAALESLRSQRSVMKSAHRRALDMASSLGLSLGLMRMVERRTAGDRALAYGGMAALALFLGAVWWMTR